MPIRYILADIDDTIVSTSGKTPISVFSGLPKLSWLIEQANLGKIARFGFCTGREASYVLGISRFMEIPDSWSITESGLVLFNPKTQERRYHPAFTPEMKEVFDEINRKRIPRLATKYPFLFPYVGKEVNVAIEVKDSTASLADCERIIRESLRDIIEFLEINVSSIAVDISPKGIDKGTGAVRLAEITGVPLSEMLLIDDSLGGKPAADRVGFLACPVNARSDFKELVKIRGENGHESPLDFAEGVAESVCFFTGVKIP
ncbi:MAG: hypothetical protein V1705_00500 [bacterium]